jgi:hypothetical protein
MATALLIERSDIVKYTVLDGNTDTDKFIQFVLIAQDIHIQQYLGTDLLEKLQADIIAGTLTGDYLALLNNYVKQMLIHWALVEYLPYSAYTLANKGVYKHTAENSDGVSKNEIDFLTEKQRTIAENYSQRFVDYICDNQSLFPEYNSNTGSDISPSSNSTIGGWYLP